MEAIYTIADDDDNMTDDNNRNLVVSRQEIVSSGSGHKKTLHITNGYQIVKNEVEPAVVSNTEPIPLQINLDPVQIALNSVGEGDLGALTEPETEDDAIKLLASHGITMLPEDPPTLTLTEAGKLALSLSTSNNVSPSPNIITSSTVKTPSLVPKVTKLVTLNQSSPIKDQVSSSAAPTSPSTPNNKPIRVIKLTPAQAEAFKRSRAAGQMTFTKDKLLSANKQANNGIDKENGEIFTSKLDSPEPPKKIIKLDNGSTILGSKDELRKRLQTQLDNKQKEVERLRAETQQAEMECDKLRSQLALLS